MGGTHTKEEVVIAQSGGQNTASTQQVQQHETTNILLIIICSTLVAGIVIILYKLAKKCHDKQIRRRLDEMRLMRYASILRRHEIKPDSVV